MAGDSMVVRPSPPVAMTHRGCCAHPSMGMCCGAQSLATCLPAVDTLPSGRRRGL